MTTLTPSHGAKLGAAAAIALALAGVASAAPLCSASSGPTLVPLVELYTSEGCSSCPPADRWLTSNFAPARGTSGASVLAFHVDYWDRLGWKDRFATAQYTQRQYATMRANGGTFVYTPQVVVQGRDTRGWQSGAADARVKAAGKQTARATIAIEAESAGDGALAVRSEAKIAQASQRKDARLWLAYTESGLESQVKAGENSGVRLAHDHVVRALHGPFAFDADGTARAAISQRLPAERGSAAALVAVVQDTRNGDVLQTLTVAGCEVR